MESDNNNSGAENAGTNSVDGVQNGLDSYTGYNSLPTQHDIDNALTSIGNQVITPASTNIGANSAKTESSNVIKKKNKRSKHTKSCEIDYEELEKALAIAAANAVVPAGSRVDPMGVSMTGSTKKKGHRRVKSGSGPKVDLDPGNEQSLSNCMHAFWAYHVCYSVCDFLPVLRRPITGQYFFLTPNFCVSYLVQYNFRKIPNINLQVRLFWSKASLWGLGRRHVIFEWNFALQF